MNNTVTFRVAGNDVLSFMEQVRKKADTLTNDMINNAKLQAASAKDQLKNVEEQIRLLEKRNRIEAASQRGTLARQRDDRVKGLQDDFDSARRKAEEDFKSGKISRVERNSRIANAEAGRDEKISATEAEYKEQLKILREQERIDALQAKLMRDNIDTIRQTSNEQLSQMRRDKTDTIEAIDDEKREDPRWQMANQFARERYKDEKEEGTGKKMVGALFNMENIKDLHSALNTAANTQNGFDLIAPASKGLGTVIGSIAGGLIGAFFGPGGVAAGLGIGGQVGTMFGSTIGEFEQRRAMAVQDAYIAQNKYEATTQKSLGTIRDRSDIGVSMLDYVNLLRQIAVNTATSSRAAENTNKVLEMEKGLGIDRNTTSEMLTYFRGTQKDIANLVEGIMQKGKGGLFQNGDYTFLNEFLQKFNQLQTTLRSHSDKVATGTTFDILNTFNRIGGMYGARDPRSTNLITGMDQALSNPGSDSLNAMSFLALRRSYPNMGFAQLMEERQKGLASPKYLKSMLDMISQIGGNRDEQIANTTWLTNGNWAAARILHDNRGKVGTMSTKELEEFYKGNFEGTAQGKTSTIERNTANLKNELLDTANKTAEAIGKAFYSAINNVLAGSTIQMQNGSITFGNNSSGLKTNTTQTNKKGATSVPSQGTKTALPAGHANAIIMD